MGCIVIILAIFIILCIWKPTLFYLFLGVFTILTIVVAFLTHEARNINRPLKIKDIKNLGIYEIKIEKIKKLLDNYLINMLLNKAT